MRVALLSDIHSNHLALQAVLEHSKTQNVDNYWFVGDLVGYGPEPIIPVKWLVGELDDFPAPEAWVLGNHDAMLAELLLEGQSGLLVETADNTNKVSEFDYPNDMVLLGDEEEWVNFTIKERDEVGKSTDRILYCGKSRTRFSKYFRWEDLGGVSSLIALEKNRIELCKEEELNKAWQSQLTLDHVEPLELHRNGVDFLLVHGGQISPLTRYIFVWQHEYLLRDEFDLLHNQAINRKFPRIQIFGHTHVPSFVKAKFDVEKENYVYDEIFVYPDKTYSLLGADDQFSLALVNPGSVGQPRDNNKQASYAVLDLEEKEITFFRVDYEFQRIIQLLALKNYPSSLQERLLSAKIVKETPSQWINHYQNVQEYLIT